MLFCPQPPHKTKECWPKSHYFRLNLVLKGENRHQSKMWQSNWDLFCIEELVLDAPQLFQCAISSQLMMDPVQTPEALNVTALQRWCTCAVSIPWAPWGYWRPLILQSSFSGSGLRDGADCAGRSFEGFWWLVSSLWTLVDHMIFIKAWQDVEFSSWRFSGSAAQSVVMPNGNFEENRQKVPKLQLCNFPGYLLQQSTAS